MWSVVELLAYLVQQFPPDQLLRFDKERLISSFSSVIDGKRVTPDPWRLGPGWTGEDTRIGKDYRDLLSKLGVSAPSELKPTELALLHNSDTMGQEPYNNPDILRTKNEWARHVEDYSRHIPVCVVVEGVEDNERILGGHMARKGTIHPHFMNIM